MKDNIYHIIAGALAAAFVALPVYLSTDNLFAGIWSAILTAAVAGGTKEWCDCKTPGNYFDWVDFGLTVAGAVAPIIIILGMHIGKG